MKSIILSLKSIIIRRKNDPVGTLKELDEYVNMVVYPFIGIISEIEFPLVNDIVMSIVQMGDVFGSIHSKPGLVFL